MRTLPIILSCLLATPNYYGTNVTAGKTTNRHLSLLPNTDVNLHPSSALALALASSSTAESNDTAEKTNLSLPPNLAHLSSLPNENLHPPSALALELSSTAESTVDYRQQQQQAIVLPPNVLTEKEEEDTTIVKEMPSDLSPSGASNSVVEADLLIRHEDLEQHQNVDVDIHKEKDEDLLPVVRHDKVRLLRLGTSLHDGTSATIADAKDDTAHSATPAAVEDGATREDATLVKASTTHPRQKRHLRLRRDHTKTPAHRDLPVMSMSTQLTPIKQFIFDDHFSTVDFETASKVAEITSKIYVISNGRINISTSEAMGAFMMEEELEPTFWHGKLDHWTKCIAIIRVLDKVHFSYDLEGEFGHLVCGDSDSPTLSPINSDSDSSTLGPSNSPSLASTTIKQFDTLVTLLLTKSRRMLLEHHERSLQITSSDCEAVLEATFKQLFANAGTDVTDLAVASFTQDSSGDLTVEFTATVDVACASANCVATSTAEVNQVIEDLLNSDAFDAALAANLEGKDCPELDGVTLVSVDATVCSEPNTCDVNDPTTCGVGDICLLQTGICPLSTCVGAPTLSPSIGPSNSPSVGPSKFPTSGPSDSPVTNVPTSNPSTSPVTDVPSSNPSKSPSDSPVTDVPTSNPSISPVTDVPTSNPSKSPSDSPVTDVPTSNPTVCNCDGYQACTNQGSDSDVSIECGSCIEENSCNYLGGASGSANVGKRSCVGTGSCYAAGNGGSATIGEGSCNGDLSCYFAGRQGSATIGEGSCNAYKACAGKGYGYTAAEIGTGECNEPCECCVPNPTYGVICDCDTKCDLSSVNGLYENCTFV